MKLDAWFGFWIFLAVLAGGIVYYQTNKAHTITAEEECAKRGGVPVYPEGFFKDRIMID